MADANAVVAIVLRFFHILFGIAWIGAVFYGVGVLRRVMPRVDPAARKALMKQLIPVVTRYLPGSAFMTILLGVILYLWIAGFNATYLLSAWGVVLLVGLVLAIVAFAIGLVFGIGTAKKMLVHFNEEACTHGPEVGALTARFNLSQVVVLVLGFAIIATMILATTHALG